MYATEMNSLFQFFFRPPQGPASILLIRLAVGPVAKRAKARCGGPSAFP